MVVFLIFTIMAAVVGVFELAIFAFLNCCEGKFVKKYVGVFIMGAVICATLTVALSVVGIFHIIGF